MYIDLDWTVKHIVYGLQQDSRRGNSTSYCVWTAAGFKEREFHIYFLTTVNRIPSGSVSVFS